jgi:hypothetical protein
MVVNYVKNDNCCSYFAESSAYELIGILVEVAISVI